jgi:peroxiredoxin
VELQRRKEEFDRANVALFGICYDPVSDLAAFTAKQGITFDLLSDEGSVVIKQLGLLNQYLDEQHAHYGRETREEQRGSAYPGSFVLDERGVVVDKLFEQSYRVRPTPAALLAAATGQAALATAPSVEATTDDLKVRAWLDSASYRPYQRLRLRFAIEIKPGLYVYGQPVPEGTTALSVSLDPLEELEADPAQLPSAHPLPVEDSADQYSVYEGTVHGAIRLMLVKYVGDVALTLRVRYQSCTQTTCYPPDEVALSLPLTGLDLVRPEVPPS